MGQGSGYLFCAGLVCVLLDIPLFFLACLLVGALVFKAWRCGCGDQKACGRAKMDAMQYACLCVEQRLRRNHGMVLHGLNRTRETKDPLLPLNKSHGYFFLIVTTLESERGT